MKTHDDRANCGALLLRWYDWSFVQCAKQIEELLDDSCSWL